MYIFQLFAHNKKKVSRTCAHLLAETAIHLHVQVAMLEFPSSAQIFARFPVEFPERLEKPDIQALRHRGAVVGKLYNKDVIVSAKLAQLLTPTVTIGSILQHYERTFRMHSAPQRNYPSHEHERTQLFVVGARFGRKNSNIITLEMLTVNPWREWDPRACWFCP
jgi:hypothetical protein